MVLSVCMVYSCGSYTLGNVRPQLGKTAEQQQLDNLTCKDQASQWIRLAIRTVPATILTVRLRLACLSFFASSRALNALRASAIGKACRMVKSPLAGALRGLIAP